MTDRYERVTKIEEPTQREVVRGREITEVDDRPSGATLAERVIWYITGAVLILLAFRFTLAALGANPGNAFANFIYDLSHPFVAPFFSLFGYNMQYGVARFEIFTLVAMAVYAVLGWALARLVTIGRPRTHHA
jgi:YggT family protein